MQPELITALAALGGAAVGGLTTVWATHRTNRAAAERETRQRDHERRMRTYTQAQEVVTDLLGILLTFELSETASSEQIKEYGLATARVWVVLPALKEPTADLLRSSSFEKGKIYVDIARFMSAAEEELEKLRPWRKPRPPHWR